MASELYRRWMFSSYYMPDAATPLLLSLVNWLLLAILAGDSNANMADLLGFQIAPMCLGVGGFFAAIIYTTIFQGIHRAPVSKGHPALFLMVAPISIGAVAIAEVA